MAYKAILVNLPTLEAGEDLEDSQYHFVKLDGDGNVVECEAGDEGDNEAIGVLLYNPDDGISATVAVGGVTKLVAGEALSVGDYVTVDGQARAKTAADGDTVYGRAIESADGADEVTSVLIGYLPSEVNLA